MSTEERMEKLERELARSDRRNRWQMAVVVLMVVGLGLAVLFRDTKTTAAETKTGAVAQQDGASASQEVIRATKIELVDGRGNLCGYWSGENPNGPELCIVTGNLNIKDKDGKRRMMLNMFEGTGLSLYDTNGMHSVSLMANDVGSILRLCDANNRGTVWLGEAIVGGVKLSLNDGKGNGSLSLAVNNDGPKLAFFDKNTKNLMFLSITPLGPMLSLNDTNGQPRAAMSVTPLGPTLGLCDENANPIWLAR